MPRAPKPVRLARWALAVAAVATLLASIVPPTSAQPEPTPAEGADTLAATLDAEMARLEAHRERLAATRRELEERRTAELAEAAGANDRSDELNSRLAIVDAGAPEVATLYERAVEDVVVARDHLRRAIAELRRPPTAPRFESQVPVDRLTAPSLAARVERLREMLGRTADERAALVELEQQLRWTVFESWVASVQRTNRLRVAAIEKLPPDRRRRVLGFGREGIAQLRREAGHVTLMVRSYIERKRHGVDEVPRVLRDVFTIGSVSWTVLKLLAVTVGYLWLRRRRGRLREAARNLLHEKRSARRREGAAPTLFDALQVVAPWGGFLLYLFVLNWMAGDLATGPEFGAILRIVAFYAGYRLAIDVLFAVCVGLSRRYRIRLDAGRLSAILRTVRTLMRVLFAVLALLAISEMFLGRGHLYHTLVRSTVVISLVTATLLLARWRSVIADTYLARNAEGTVARLVRSTRDRWYGVFVSGVAFLLLAATALMRVLRDTALGFEQTRRGLAFLFRRRVEKLAERAGYADGDVERLPAAVVAAFSEEPATDEGLSIDRFPGREAFERMRDEWLAEHVGASFLLSGEKGMGKTTWLRQAPTADLPYCVISLEGRLLSDDRLATVLAEGLSLDLEGADLRDIRRLLNEGPKRIVAVDLTQNLFLSTVGGYATFQSFAELIEATCERVLWICAMSAFAREHLFGVRADLMVFRHHEVLHPWSEEELGALIARRCETAGIRVEYDELLDQRGYGQDGSEETVEAEAGYARLLWDYSDGNPRAALHFWLRSLVPLEDDRFSVRLFRAPPADELEALGARAGFLLKAIVVHENLTLRELATATRYPIPVCRMQLGRLEDLGILRRDKTRYRITTHWHRAVVRYLKRVNLIS